MPHSSIFVFDSDPVRCARSVAELSQGGIAVRAFDDPKALHQRLTEISGGVVFVFEDAPDEEQTGPKPLGRYSEESEELESGDEQERLPLAAFVAALAKSNAAPLVYVFSSCATVEEGVSCMRWGAADYIAFPAFDSVRMMEIARSALTQKILGRATVHKGPPKGVGRDDTDAYARRLIETARGTRHFANCLTFPELAAQALKVLRANLQASGGALFLMHNAQWRMMHAADLAHDFVLDCPHDDALEHHFAGRNTATECAGDGPLTRFLRKERGAMVAFALRTPEGALTGLLLIHRPNAGAFNNDDVEIGRLIMDHVTEALKSIRLTQSLRESEARFHSIASNVPGVVFQAQCTPGEIVSFKYMSDSSSEFFGIRPERFLFAPVVFLERVVVDDLPALLRTLRESVESIGQWRWEGRIVGNGGRTRWIQLTARPSISRDRPDEVTYDGLMLDITEAKELEFQLQLADRMISVGTLAAGVAHEINNPLTYVLANLGLIREEINDLGPFAKRTELNALLDEASEGAERVTQIVRDLKVFSRGDEQRADSAISVEAVIDSSLNMAANELRHRARIVKDFQDLPYVRANRARLGQVFINLLINAAQAIPEGQRDKNEVRITLRSDDDEHVVISVSDTGSGIAAESRKRIFDPFFTTKPVGVGTGLGLPICHRIVEEVGGEISVESAPGRGSTFTVTLPRCAPSAAEVAAEESSSGRKAAPQRRARVLVVDDEKGVVSALKRGLRNHDVTTADGGKEALECIENDAPFDVILCDLMMPQFSGMDLFAALEQEHPDVAKRVVFMTGGAFTTRAKAFLRDANHQHISKPFLLRDIEALIQSRLSASHALPITGSESFRQQG